MPKNVLVADDSVVIQKSIGITFAQEDFTVTFAGNGEEAFQKAKQVKPDLILADIVMPKKNGYELCDMIRKDPDLKNISVLLLAGTHEPFDEARGKTVGADGHVIKPFESAALVTRVKQILTSGRPASAPAPAAAPPPPPPPAAPSPSSTIAGQASYTPAPQAETPSPTSTIMAAEPPSFDLEWAEPEAAPAPAAAESNVDFAFDQSMNHGETTEVKNAPTAEVSPPTQLPVGEFWDFSADGAQEPEHQPEPASAPAESAAWGTLSGSEPIDVAPEPAAESGGAFGFDLMSESIGGAEPAPAAEIPYETTVAKKKPEPTAVEMSPANSSESFTEPLGAFVESIPTAAPTNLQLSNEQIEAIVSKVFERVIERIAWEVVPDLAERIIKDELARLTKDKP